MSGVVAKNGHLKRPDSGQRRHGGRKQNGRVIALAGQMPENVQEALNRAARHGREIDVENARGRHDVDGAWCVCYVRTTES